MAPNFGVQMSSVLKVRASEDQRATFFEARGTSQQPPTHCEDFSKSYPETMRIRDIRVTYLETPM